MDIEWIRLTVQAGVAGIVATALSTVIVRFYLGGYLREKGKALARKEDIELLRKEVQVLTKEAETIKATIGHEVWGKQQQWEKKREAYGELIRHLMTLSTVSARLGALVKNYSSAKDKDDPWVRHLFDCARAQDEKFPSEVGNAATAAFVAQIWANPEINSVIVRAGENLQGIEQDDDFFVNLSRAAGGLADTLLPLIIEDLKQP